MRVLSGWRYLIYKTALINSKIMLSWSCIIKVNELFLLYKMNSGNIVIIINVSLFFFSKKMIFKKIWNIYILIDSNRSRRPLQNGIHSWKNGSKIYGKSCSRRVVDAVWSVLIGERPLGQSWCTGLITDRTKNTWMVWNSLSNLDERWVVWLALIDIWFPQAI